MKKQLSIKQIEPKFKLDIRSACSYSPIDLFGKRNADGFYRLDFDVLLSNGQPLQREHVWTLEQKRALIISMLKELKLPEFLVVQYDNESRGADRQKIFKIIDGKQRLTAIKEFANNEFGIIVDDKEYFLSDLDSMAAYRFNCYSLNFRIIYEYSDAKLTDEQLIGAFEYVNFAGTPQDTAHFEKLKTYL